MQDMKFIEYLRKQHDMLSELMGEPKLDWDNLVYATDTEIEEQAEYYSQTHHAPNTTPIYEIQ